MLETFFTCIYSQNSAEAVIDFQSCTETCFEVHTTKFWNSIGSTDNLNMK